MLASPKGTKSQRVRSLWFFGAFGRNSAIATGTLMTACDNLPHAEVV